MDHRTRQAKESQVLDMIRRKGGIDCGMLHDDRKLQAAVSRLEREGKITETSSGQTFPWLQYKINRGRET